MGKNYNNAVFEALLRLYQSDDSFSQELAERLESLLYGQPTDPNKNKPTAQSTAGGGVSCFMTYPLMGNH